MWRAVLLALLPTLALAFSGNQCTVKNGIVSVTCADNAVMACLAGRAGGQTIIGGTGAGDNLNLQSTQNSTPGFVSSNDPFRVTDQNSRSPAIVNSLGIFGNTTGSPASCATNGVAKMMTLVDTSAQTVDASRTWQLCYGTSNGPAFPVSNMGTLVTDQTTAYAYELSTLLRATDAGAL
jgi:hypothetical protein